jgi:hypothetical protein
MADLSLSSDDRARLAEALGCEVDTETFEERVGLLEQLALDEMVNWVLGRQRFETISALDRHRILEIFARVRRQAPTVEALANELAISESRATSMLSRMRYGEARLIRRLTYEAALADVRTRVANVAVHNNRKFIWVTSETGRAIDEANTSIMMDYEGRREGGRYVGAEKAERTSVTRTGQEWSASERMWQYIETRIAESAEQLGA